MGEINISELQLLDRINKIESISAVQLPDGRYEMFIKLFEEKKRDILMTARGDRRSISDLNVITKIIATNCPKYLKSRRTRSSPVLELFFQS